MKNTPLPSELSGEIVERLIRVDKSLLYLIAGALEFAVDREPYDETGTLTVEEVREALGEMLWNFYTEDVRLPIIGETIWMPYSYAPPKWMYCDGAAISRDDYPELFAEIGVIWGAGNGTTTFNLPDLNGRSPMGSGTPAGGGSDSMVIGQITGQQKHTLVIGEIPSHSHNIVLRGSLGAGSVARSGSNDGTTANFSTQAAGTGNSHNNTHPVAVGKFIIYVGH